MKKGSRKDLRNWDILIRDKEMKDKCMVKKKIIVTGASGFIGSALVKWLCDRTVEGMFDVYRIIGIDRNPIPEELKDLHDYRHHQCDINDNLPDERDIYAIIHLAAKAGVRGTNFNEYLQDNVQATQKLLEKCKTWKPKKFIFTSSSSIYNNQSPYAYTKIACEELVNMYKKNESLKCKFITLRLYTVYGPNQREGLAIRNFVDGILSGNPITIFGNGHQRRSFTYIDDICEAYRLTLENNINGDYDVGSNYTPALFFVIHEICKLTNKPVTIKFEPFNPLDAFEISAVGRNEEFCEKTGWFPNTKFEDGLRNQILWQQSMYEKECKNKK